MAKKSNRKALYISITIFLSIMIGIFTSVVGISRIENYFHPYYFAIIFGGLGVGLGIWLALKLKPYIAITEELKNDYFSPVLYISIGFLGIFLLAGSYFNQSLSKIEKCESYTVINKYKQESGFRRPGTNSLIVNFDGNGKRLLCSKKYWQRISIGQEIVLCLHKSKLGFDYISIVNDKE